MGRLRGQHAALGGGLLAMTLLTASCGSGLISSTPYLDKLAEGRLHVGYPTFTPDGTELLFDYFFTGGKFGVMSDLRPGVYELETERILPLPLPEGFNWEVEEFSSDGRYVAFTKSCWKRNGCPDGERGSWIVLLDARGETLDIQQLDNSPGVVRETPAFSPDGRWIAYAEASTSHLDRHGQQSYKNAHAVVMQPVDGGPARTLFPLDEHVSYPLPISELSITHLSFIDEDEILIGGYAPSQIRKRLPRLYGSPKHTTYLHLTIGGAAIPIEDSPRFGWARDFPDLSQLRFTSSGLALFAADARDSTGKTMRGKADLYIVGNGKVRALNVHRLGHGYGDISSDGSTVATSSTGGIILVDTATGAVKVTAIRDYILERAREETGGEFPPSTP